MASVSENQTSNSCEVNNPLSVLNDKRGLKMAHFNIRTLPGNFDQVKILLHNHPVDVIAFSETRLDEFISDSEISVDNYQLYRKDRNRNGGGVILYVSNTNCHHKLREDLMISSLELVAIELTQGKSKPIIVLAWYRPPNSNMDLFDDIERVLSITECENKDFILMGDLNCNLLSPNPSCHTKRLVDICEDANLEQVINEPTRVVQHTSTLIDVLFTTNKLKITGSGVIHVGLSDHSLIYVLWGRTDSKVGDHIYKVSRSYSKLNEEHFLHDLANVNWNCMLGMNDIDGSLEFLKNYFLVFAISIK